MIRVILLLIPLTLLARDWTALVYMAADNDLAQWADSDLVELESVGSDDHISILIQLDKPGIGARRLLVEPGSSIELQDLGQIDMCDWETLSSFLEWGIRMYPADRYIVILWDHGTGWTVTPRRYFGTDWSSGNRMSISNGDLQRAISSAHQYTNEVIDLIAFDACLMQMIEVVYELKDYANVCVALQSLCPLQGFAYDRIFEMLAAQPGMNEIAFSKIIMSENVLEYTNSQAVTFSAVNLKKIDPLKLTCDETLDAIMEDSRGFSFTALRNSVQTIPIFGQTPDPDDEYIDMGDFIEGLHALVGSALTEDLGNIYNETIITSGYWHSNFHNTTGLSIWFPLHYRQFKSLLDDYRQLDWAQSHWLRFLNWHYNADDIRPTPVDNFTVADIGSNNDFHLRWSASYDLALVSYDIIEGCDSGFVTIFNDQCDNFNRWNVNGFLVDSINTHGPSYSFFSGNNSNLQNWIETIDPIHIEQSGMVTLYLDYTTEDMTDSLIIECGPLKDVHYGQSQGWEKRTIIVPAGDHRLKISYHTNNSINRGGCFIDDITIEEIVQGTYLRRYIQDTSLYVFNKLRGTYHYAVYPIDAFGNTGNVSDFRVVSLEQYAVPYSLPNPFQTTCHIVLDYPDTSEPNVTIFSISGRLIRKFEPNDVHDNMILWNGQDEQGRSVASGLYYVLLTTNAFKRIGKIARQR